MKRGLFLIGVFMMLVSAAWAQQTVSGTVTSSETGDPLVGVTILVEGTTTGAFTNESGAYTLRIPEGGTNLIFSFINKKQEVVAIDGRSTIDVKLVDDLMNLDEVVITSVGLKKQKRSLGYATQNVNNDLLVKASNPNVITSLAGKVAGVQINQATGAVGGSARIVIRGSRSFTGNNQPLFVIDGIPIDNSQLASQDRRSNADFGNAAQDINPDDVESINVLKGPAAAALYGSRAANGAIMITTKSGKNAASRGRKAEISVSSSLTFDEIMYKPDQQTTFGGGNQGIYSAIPFNAWGPRIEGQTVLNPLNAFPNEADSVSLRAYDAYDQFYQTGETWTNTFSLAGGDRKNDYRLSFSDTRQTGIAPNTDFNRTTVTGRAGANITDKLRTDFSVTFTRTQSDNIPLGGQNRSFVRQFLWNPPNVDWNGMRDYENADGTANDYSTFWANPYWILNKNTIGMNRNRFNGFFSISYDFNDWLNFTGRVGTDWYNDRRTGRTAINTQGNLNGDYWEDEWFVREFTTDFLLSANKDIGSDFNISGLIGFNLRERDRKNLYGQATALVIPDFYDFDNADGNTVTENDTRQRRLLGVYGTATIGFRNYAFLEFTGRNDWSSTLPTENNGNSFFYPSVSGTLVLTDAIPSLQNNILSFAKLRANWAEVGNDAQEYRLQSLFVQGRAFNSLFDNLNFPFGSQPGFAVGGTIGNRNLSPEFTRSWEIGAEVSLFQDRFYVDFSYFSSTTTDQIFDVEIPRSTGFTTLTANAGEMKNSGFETMITARPVYFENGFRWTVNLNFSQINNEVVELNEDLQAIDVPPAGFTSTQIQARVGFTYPSIVGRKFQRTDDGQLIINPATGTPILESNFSVLGTAQPDYLFGFGNTFEWKGISLYTLVDLRQGGNFYSLTAAHFRQNGLSQETVAGRNGVVVDGVIENADGSFRPNDIAISGEDFWSDGSVFQKSEFGLYDASFIKLREVRISYDFPQALLQKTPISSLQIGAVGRNLWLDTPNPIIDPEVNLFGNQNAQGYEYAQMPTTRSYGFNVRMTF